MAWVACEIGPPNTAFANTNINSIIIGINETDVHPQRAGFEKGGFCMLQGQYNPARTRARRSPQPTWRLRR